MKAFIFGVLVGWTACRFWWDETIEAADREAEDYERRVFTTPGVAESIRTAIAEFEEWKRTL